MNMKNFKEFDLDEARMSAALRMANAIDKQRAKSDASRARTPSSIPKKEEPKRQGVAEGSDYTSPKLGTVKANLMNTQKPTVQVQVFKHNTLRGDSYWVTKEVKTFKTMDQGQAYVDRINKKGLAEASDRMQRYGQLILKRKAEQNAAAQSKKEEPPASSDYSSMSDRDFYKQLRDQRRSKKKGVAKGLKEDNEYYDKAEEHLSKANDAEAKGHMKSFHTHMADHHDAMSEWHDSKGRSASADKHADKAEYHHEKSLTVK